MALTVYLPYDRSSLNHSVQVAISDRGIKQSADAITLAELQHAAQLDLRRPLYDVPSAPPPASPAPAPLSVRLLGTLVEPGHSRAILVGSDGRSVLKAVGENINDAQLLEIGPDSVTLGYRGTSVVLITPKAPMTP